MMILAVMLSVGVGLVGAGALLLAVFSLLFKVSIRPAGEQLSVSPVVEPQRQAIG